MQREGQGRSRAAQSRAHSRLAPRRAARAYYAACMSARMPTACRSAPRRAHLDVTSVERAARLRAEEAGEQAADGEEQQQDGPARGQQHLRREAEAGGFRQGAKVRGWAWRGGHAATGGRERARRGERRAQGGARTRTPVLERSEATCAPPSALIMCALSKKVE